MCVLVKGPVHVTLKGRRMHSATGSVAMKNPPPQVEFVPPQTPHESITLPLLGMPSQPKQRLLSPPHTPHASRFLPLLGKPSHPTQELFPRQIPHRSMTAPLNGTSSQPTHALVPPQMPQRSLADALTVISGVEARRCVALMKYTAERLMPETNTLDD